MKHISIQFDEETIRQIKELAERWGLPEIRHNTQVVLRCVERVWNQEIGCAQFEESEEKEENAENGVDM